MGRAYSNDLRERVGAICFLAKPFAGPALISCVEAALNRHHGETSQ
jgi:FixJ family two-component response regulator